MLHKPTPTGRVSPYNADAEGGCEAGEAGTITVPVGCLPRGADMDQRSKYRTNPQKSSEENPRALSSEGARGLTQTAMSTGSTSRQTHLRVCLSLLSVAADAEVGSCEPAVTCRWSTSFLRHPATARSGLSARFRGNGRTQRRRARPPRGARGSCCRALNSAPNGGPSHSAPTFPFILSRGGSRRRTASIRYKPG